MKRCSKCGIEKVITEFSLCRAIKKDGRQPRCKDCMCEYHKEYYREHKDVKAEYYRVNRERILELQKDYRNKHKERILKRHKEYNKEHRGRILELQKEYSKTPTGKLAHARSRHKRRALLKKERSDITLTLWAKILELQNNKCNCCHKKFTKKRTPTQDHIVPISKGGSLKSYNIQALCQSCNSTKHAKLDQSFIQTWSM